jgi:DNA repair protein RadC
VDAGEIVRRCGAHNEIVHTRSAPNLPGRRRRVTAEAVAAGCAWRGRPLGLKKAARLRTVRPVPDNVRIKDLPPSERPRERLLEKGAEALGTDELIAILLRTGTAGVSALDAARQLITRFGTLDALARAKPEELGTVPGLGRDKAVTLKAAFTLAQRMAREIHREPPLLDTPALVADYLREDNRCREVEHFQVLLLNTRRRLIRMEPVSQGTLDTLLVHPREVFRSAIVANASALVLAHNHPSGDPTPSEADIKVTRDLIRAGQVLKIDVLDHVILGRRTDGRDKDYVSLRELGYFYS